MEAGLISVNNGGFYFSDLAISHMLHSLQRNEYMKEDYKLSEKEQLFLELSCSEFTYKEIGEKMSLSVKTIDGYRISLFEKLQVKSRVGMVIYALKVGLVRL